MSLFKHQLDIVREDPAVAGLFFGTGTGKTLIALSLARGKTLVICPKTQAEDRNWQRENETHKLKVNLTVMSKEAFRRDAASLSKFDTVIVDEAHTCLGATPSVRWITVKGQKCPIPKTSQLYEALGLYLMEKPPKRFYLCTATIMKSPMTVWAAAKLLGQDWDFYEFRNVFYVRLPMPGREVFVSNNAPEVKDRLAAAVRTLGHVGRLDDFFDVPAQTYKTIFVKRTQEQEKRIMDMDLEYPDPLTRCGKIHQIENGILSGDEFNEPEFFETEKTDHILNLSLEYPRMVIFVKYIAQITQLQKDLKKQGKNIFVMMGGTKDRGAIIKKLNLTEEYIFIVQASISAGWQLGKTKDHPEYYDCNCMVFLSRTFSFVDYDQGLGRIQRGDNIKKNLYVHIVTKGGTDEAVHKSLLNKQDFNERLYVSKKTKDFYVCPNHIKSGGYESCCACGGWKKGEEKLECTEASNT